MSSPALRQVATGAAAVLLSCAGLLSPATAHASTGCPAPASEIVRTAPGAGRTVALTFDDGPSRFTPQVLAVLRRYDVRATFFETGAHVARHPALARQVAAEGHLLGDHTYDHEYPSHVDGGWTPSYLHGQLRRTNRLETQASGHPTCFFRPPGGFQTTGMVRTAGSLHMSTVLWSVDSEDWKQPAEVTGAATDRVVVGAEAGVGQSHPVVLMHDGKASHEPEWQVSSNRGNDIAALPRIIRFYQSHGYRFVDLLGGSGLPPAPTTLSMTTGQTRVRAGSRVTVLRGTLRAITGPVPGERVRWYSRDEGGTVWTLRGTVRTDRHGQVSVTDRPDRSTEYRLAFRGDRRYAAATPTGLRTVAVTGAVTPPVTPVTVTGTEPAGGAAAPAQ